MKRKRWIIVLSIVLALALVVIGLCWKKLPFQKSEPNYGKEDIIRLFNEHSSDYERVLHYFEDSGRAVISVGRTKTKNGWEYDVWVNYTKASEAEAASILAELEALDYTEWLDDMIFFSTQDVFETTEFLDDDFFAAYHEHGHYFCKFDFRTNELMELGVEWWAGHNDTKYEQRIKDDWFYFQYPMGV